MHERIGTTAMFDASAEFYDLIYSTLKSRTAEPALHTKCNELGLFTTDELLGAFRSAGLQAEFDPSGLADRGLYIARPATSEVTRDSGSQP